MKNRTDIQRQNNSSLNNILNNILNKVFNKVFNNIPKIIDNLAIVGTFFLWVYGELYSTLYPHVNYYSKYINYSRAHERR